MAAIRETYEETNILLAEGVNKNYSKEEMLKLGKPLEGRQPEMTFHAFCHLNNL